MSNRAMAHSVTRGHVVTVCHPSDGRRELPALTIGGLALELAGMIRETMPAALVSIVRIDLTPKTRPKAEQQTHTIKHLVIEARDAEQPGHAFLSASGYLPQNATTAKE
jgi:hypothetical protein